MSYLNCPLRHLVIIVLNSSHFPQIQSLWLLRRVLVEHTGPPEWRRTVAAQLLALIGRLWLETHLWDPAFKPNHQAVGNSTDEEEVGKDFRIN